MGKIFLIRHAQASFGADDYDELSALGAEQARMLGSWFARCDVHFDIVFTGRHRRHRQTAGHCLPSLETGGGPELVADPDLDEYDAHAVIGAAAPDLREPARLRAWLAADPERSQHAFQRIFSTAFQRWVDGDKGGDYAETWCGFRARCVGALERIAERCAPRSNVAIFTSGGPIAAMCQHVLGIPDANVASLHFAVPNTSVTKLMCQPGRFGLGYLNSVAHLESDGRRNMLSYR